MTERLALVFSALLDVTPGLAHVRGHIDAEHFAVLVGIWPALVQRYLVIQLEPAGVVHQSAAMGAVRILSPQPEPSVLQRAPCDAAL